MRLGRVSRIVPIFLCLSICLWFGSQSANADVVYKRDGARLKGEIVEENRDFVKIKVFGSIYKIPREEILKIEKSGDIQSQYQSKLKKINDQDDRAWVKLGYWCQEKDLIPESIDCFYNAISVNPDEKDARWELGHRKYRGKWVTSGEYYRAKGYVRYRGLWVTKEDKAKYEAGLVKDKGEWITREEYVKRVKDRNDKDLFGDGGLGSEDIPMPVPEADNSGGKRRKAMRNPFGFAGGAVNSPRAKKPESPDERKALAEKIKASGNWQHVHMSKYYNFFSNGSEAESKTYGAAMDRACVTFKKVFGYKPEITRSFPIFMYGNQREFMSRTGRGPGVGGFYSSTGKIVSFHSKDALSTLFHEGTHQFQGLALGNNMWSAKIWFVEGLAVYFEGAKVRSKDIDTSHIPKDRLAHVKRAIQSRRHIKLSTLIRMEQREFGALHYAHAWSLIYFLVNGTKGGKKRFIQYFNGVKRGEDGEKLFEECFDKPIEVIEKAWIEYVKRLRA